MPTGSQSIETGETTPAWALRGVIEKLINSYFK
jgi:hypothetical protein